MKTKSPKLLFLLDYDGTLADFDRNPDHARLSPETRRILTRLRAKHPVILVSGRNVQSLRRVSGLKNFPMVGSHGFEASRLPGQLSMSTPAQQKRFRREAGLLDQAFREFRTRFPGLHIERKPFSATIHYRGLKLPDSKIRELEKMFHATVKKTATSGIWVAQGGKQMLEAKPKGFSKGQAVLKLIKQFPGSLPLYAGDDVTDISAFQALGAKGLKVSVGDRIPPDLVNLNFPGPRQFVDWLKAFL